MKLVLELSRLGKALVIKDVLPVTEHIITILVEMYFFKLEK